MKFAVIGFTTVMILSTAWGTQRQWVYFESKPVWSGEPTELISPRSVERRLKDRSSAEVIDWYDWPLDTALVNAVVNTGAELIARSRYLNAVSVVVPESQRAELLQIPGVRKVEPVRGYHKDYPIVQDVEGTPQSREDYGFSLDQLEQIQVPALHDAGLDGTGILIGHNDTGARLDHEAFANMDILATWDFINDDPIVQNEEGDAETQHRHGTLTLSTIGGYVPGVLIGPAYAATYVVAKTEDVTSETPVEEDYWIEAVEWEDSLGVDLTTTSLGYSDWYTYEDMDGDTAPITVAADIAASHGIAMFNSAGNEGSGSWYYITSPADGDSVITIGAVDEFNERVYFSSHGPTYDGRIKPDLMALGWAVYCATHYETDSYGTAHGTSLSTPLAAGAAALLLQGHPEWSNMDLLNAMQQTGTNWDNPDNDMGWGVIQALDALNLGSEISLSARILYGGVLLQWTRIPGASYHFYASHEPYDRFEYITTVYGNNIFLPNPDYEFFRITAVY